LTERSRICCLLLLLFCQPLQAAQVWVAGWQQTEPMNTRRAGAAVLRSGDYIYAIGGIDGVDFLTSVEYSRIKADGSLTPWHRTAALNEARGFFDAVAYQGYLYAVGGANGPSGEHLLNTVERAPIRKDGSLGPWQREASTLVLPRRCVKLARSGRTLYALGGFGGTLLDSVERAEISANGSLSTWSLEKRPMTMPRYVNSVVQARQRIYVIGGHEQQEGSGIQAVEYAALQGDDRLQPWQRTAAMKIGRFALAGATHGNALYALGGLRGAIYTAAVETSRIKADGSLAPWRTTTPLSSPRADFGTVVHGANIYIIGGTNRDGYYRTVEYARFDQRDNIGFQTTATAAAAFEAQRSMAATRPATPLPNAGIVTDLIHTRIYSYIQVKNHGERRWLAAPRAALKIGDRIRYSRGVTMTDFHSNARNRDFELIIFVERVEKTADDR